MYNGARYESDFLWNPSEIKRLTNLKYIPVLSKETERWKGENGYVQDIILKDSIDLSNTQVYACGSNDMIESAKKTLVENGLNENQFFSDAFVQSN